MPAQGRFIQYRTLRAPNYTTQRVFFFFFLNYAVRWMYCVTRSRNRLRTSSVSLINALNSKSNSPSHRSPSFFFFFFFLMSMSVTFPLKFNLRPPTREERQSLHRDAQCWVSDSPRCVIRIRSSTSLLSVKRWQFDAVRLSAAQSKFSIPLSSSVR
jgi:hypothetical protein